MGAGAVFCEMAEKRQLPYFCFLGTGRNWRLAEPGGGVLQKSTRQSTLESTLEDQQLATCDTLTGNREPKWKSWMVRMTTRIAVLSACVLRCLGPVLPTTVNAQTSSSSSYVWCWAAPAAATIHKSFMSAIFQGSASDRREMEAQFQQFVFKQYLNPEGAGPGRCSFFTSRNAADNSREQYRAEARFEEKELIDTGWSYSH